MKKYAILLLSLFVLTTCESDDPIQFELSTQVNPPEGGIISPSSGTFDEGEEITFTATPSEEYVFKNWSDDASGDENPMKAVMTDDMFITANFEKRTYPLTIEIQGEGTVKEEIVPGKSTTDYPSGTTVQLTAIPEDEWEFVRWEGPMGTSTTNPMELSITGPVAIKAFFQKVSYAVTIEVQGEGTVKEEIVPGKTTTDYPSGTTVALTAIPEDEWVFVKWSGDYEGGENPLELLIDKPMSLTAIFEPANIEKIFVPDDHFEQALISLGLDHQLDDYVNSNRINSIEELRLDGKQIEDLTGIEGFENLKVLNVSNNLLQSIDLSHNFFLQHLICDRNQLTSLDISQNINLESLVATANQLTCVQGSSYLLFWINFVGGPGAPWFALDEGVELSTACSVSQNQRTYVPDDAFEQALIDTGLDDVLDDYVNTIEIVNRFLLDISGRNISDLTGLEDFTGLIMLDASSNNLTTVDMSEWGYFDNVDFRDNPISCIQINEFQQRVLGNRMIIETDNEVRISLDCAY